MTVGILVLLALLELALGVTIFADAKSSIHEILGLNLIGFATVSFGMAGVLWELRNARREAATDRQIALEERQARAALDLKRRSGMISSIDRRQRQTENAAPAAVKADKAGPEKANIASAVKVGAARSCSNGSGHAAPVLALLQSGSAQLGRKRHWELLTSCAGVGYIYGAPSDSLRTASIGSPLTPPTGTAAA